ncbi:MAG: carbonic anhydrase [Alphaproteobacteria bacterium]|nr:carbonic anhydrase [Alphaproteobacteria bacterium]
MDKLIEGYRRFRSTQWPERRITFQELAREGQSPRAMVIACCDSRVDPSMIFGAAPGELFVVRNVANLVPPYAPDGRFHATSAALEFGVCVLQVQDLIVMGHAMCGGIRALLEGPPVAADDFLGSWMSVAESAKRRVLESAAEDRQTACEQEAVKLSLDNLRSFPWIRQRIAARRLTTHGATFDIRSGVLSLLRPDGRFAAVS